MAQDKIFQSNGNVIDARIKMVKDGNVIYWHWNDLHGSLYAISLGEVDKIRYENGSEEVFNGANSENVPSSGMSRPDRYTMNRRKMGSKVVAVSSLAFSENGIGAAVSYEKAIDKDGIIAFTLPLTATFNLNGEQESLDGKNEDAMFYVSPGLKFYPTGSYGTLKYAVGPSLVLGAGQKTTGGYTTQWNAYSPVTVFEPYNTRTKLMMGIMINNSLNINPTDHLYMGIECGFGFTYINRLNNENFGVTGIVQGGFKIGYRF